MQFKISISKSFPIFIFYQKEVCFISLYKFIESLDFSLEKNITSYNNSFVNSFIDELKNHLTYLECIENLKKFPADSLFTLDRFEGDFAICENQTSGKLLDIHKSVVDSSANEGDVLHFDGNKLLLNSVETEKQKKIISDLINNNFKYKHSI